MATKKLFVSTVKCVSVKKHQFDCVRCMSRMKTRFTMPPFWQPKPTRVLYPEHITKSNAEFLKEHINESYENNLNTETSSLLKFDTFERGEWQPNSYRCGLITRKIGVMPMWMKNGTRILATLLHVCDNHVIKYIPPEILMEHDYKYKRRVQKKERPLGALIVGADSADPRYFTKEYFKIFESSGVYPKRRLSKFYITPNAVLPPGFPLSAAHYRPGDRVDCSGITIDRGFQGVMKRWGFKGNRATHGTTKSHRRPGNIGGGKGAEARVWPGTKMPGHMGRHKRTLRAATVIRVNMKYNVIFVRGPVAGEVGNYVLLNDTIYPMYRRGEDKKHLFPTYFDDEDLGEDLFLDTLHDFRQPSIAFSE